MPKVVPLRPSSVAGKRPFDHRSQFDQERMRRHLCRFWRVFLTPSEFYLLDLIIDQTVGMGRPQGVPWGFSYRMLEHGDEITAGTGLDKRHLIRLIASLVRKSFIIADRNSKGLTITPNIARFLEEEGQPPPKRTEKARGDAQTGDISVTSLAQSGDTDVTPYGDTDVTHKRERGK